MNSEIIYYPARRRYSYSERVEFANNHIVGWDGLLQIAGRGMPYSRDNARLLVANMTDEEFGQAMLQYDREIGQ